MRPTRDDLQAARGRGVPDLVGDDARLLLVGVNPGLWTAAVQAHFAHPGNRFWKAMYAAGLTARPVDASEGLRPDDAADLLRRGIAITNLVNRATARADELTTDELRRGVEELRRKVRRWRPRVVVVLGLGAYRTAFRRPRARRGRQDEDLEGAALWVVGNPSGLNAHETVERLAEALGSAAAEAGVDRVQPSRHPEGST